MHGLKIRIKTNSQQQHQQQQLDSSVQFFVAESLNLFFASATKWNGLHISSTWLLLFLHSHFQKLQSAVTLFQNGKKRNFLPRKKQRKKSFFLVLFALYFHRAKYFYFRREMKMRKQWDRRSSIVESRTCVFDSISINNVAMWRQPFGCARCYDSFSTGSTQNSIWSKLVAADRPISVSTSTINIWLLCIADHTLCLYGCEPYGCVDIETNFPLFPIVSIYYIRAYVAHAPSLDTHDYLRCAFGCWCQSNRIVIV